MISGVGLIKRHFTAKRFRERGDAVRVRDRKRLTRGACRFVEIAIFSERRRQSMQQQRIVAAAVA